jgi:hypothetical protein
MHRSNIFENVFGDFRRLYYMAILGCIVSGILLVFNIFVGLMYYRFYLS